jgi:hypothetical protein
MKAWFSGEADFHFWRWVQYSDTLQYTLLTVLEFLLQGSPTIFVARIYTYL